MISPAHTTRVVCFGNRLHGDDAVACHVYEHLRTVNLPDGTSIHDGGTAGLSALLLFQECEQVIVVDAIAGCTAEAAGTLRWRSVVSLMAQRAELSTHAQGLEYLLQVLPLSSGSVSPTSIAVLTVAVARIAAFSEQLSPPVAQAVPRAAAAVRLALQDAAAGRPLPMGV